MLILTQLSSGGGDLGGCCLWTVCVYVHTHVHGVAVYPVNRGLVCLVLSFRPSLASGWPFRAAWRPLLTGPGLHGSLVRRSRGLGAAVSLVGCLISVELRCGGQGCGKPEPPL